MSTPSVGTLIEAPKPAKTKFLSNREILFYRRLMGCGAGAYLLWWFAVEYFLPNSYNPIGSRLFVVGFLLFICLGSYSLPWLRERIANASAFAMCLLTFHYFYLFYFNIANIDWVVGAYITVVAACYCLESERNLFGYNIFVFLLSLMLSIGNPTLGKTIFLPGVITILAFAYLGLRSRLKYVSQSFEHAQRIQSLFDATFEGIMVHDNGIVLNLNEALANLFGYQRKDIIGRKILDFLPAHQHAKILANLATWAETPLEVIALHADGSEFPVEIRPRRHLLDGRYVRITAVRDLTQAKRTEAELIAHESTREALKIREEFISVVAHELKTPLTNIQLLTQIAKRNMDQGGMQAFGPDRVKRLVDQTGRQASNLNKLVDEMLDISRLSTGRLPLRFEVFDLSKLLQEVLDSLFEAIQDRRVELKTDIVEGLWVSADKFRLEQVIVNVIINALKYGGQQQSVFVRTRARDGEALIEVQDYGIGIAKEHQKRIFEKFERAVPSKNISGLGLGLYICQQLLEAQGGKIEVESEIGKGAKFTVMLPVLSGKAGVPDERS